MQRVVTCFVCDKAQLATAKSWKDVLDPRKNSQEEYFGVASVISLHPLTLNYLGHWLCAWQ